MNLVTLLYLIASICFIQALKGPVAPDHLAARQPVRHGRHGPGHPHHGRAGLQTRCADEFGRHRLRGAGPAGGGTAGSIMAKRVEMTKMPELVAFMHSMIGLAAVFIAIAAVLEVAGHRRRYRRPDPDRQPARAVPGRGHWRHHLLRLGDRLRQAVGKYRFRLFQGAPVQFVGQHKLNLILA
ncbi:NAD(P)(+) transhydrogenase (Re/Si-specific) subunit beta [Pseudomonas alabamensis]|uniref:NAD(P)(+) transhydrogenase (Re/Si-specific) subunit beta n=1 Tax=Pseudomonas alabamensis TaxID=3064349 RepID=UPI003D16066D